MIAIGCDHGGYELKQKILAHLRDRGLAYKDFGCDSTASVDYPVYGKAKKASSSAAPASVSPLPPTRCPASAVPCAGIAFPPGPPGSTTMPMC